MATAAATRSFLRSSSSLRNASSSTTRISAGTSRPPFRLPKPNPTPTTTRIIFRSPVESSFSVESLLPMHSATASALMTSMLPVTSRGYGWLSEAGSDGV